MWRVLDLSTIEPASVDISRFIKPNDSLSVCLYLEITDLSFMQFYFISSYFIRSDCNIGLVETGFLVSKLQLFIFVV